MRSVAVGFLSLCVAMSAGAQVDPAKPTPAAPPATTDSATPDPVVEAWVKLLAERIADANKVVRDSSQQALVAVGKPAIPALKALAASTDAATSAEAKRVLERIERQAARGEAGRPGGPTRAEGERPGQVTPESLAKELALSAEQEEKLTQALEERSKKLRELFGQVQDGSLTREEMQAQNREAGEKVLKDMKAVLSEEQFSKFEESFRRMRTGQGGRRRGGG
jgi:hypothetical protein